MPAQLGAVLSMMIRGAKERAKELEEVDKIIYSMKSSDIESDSCEMDSDDIPTEVTRAVTCAILEFSKWLQMPTPFKNETEFLESELKRAIEQEDYELAAVLRDKIKAQ